MPPTRVLPAGLPDLVGAIVLDAVRPAADIRVVAEARAVAGAGDPARGSDVVISACVGAARSVTADATHAPLGRERA